MAGARDRSRWSCGDKVGLPPRGVARRPLSPDRRGIVRPVPAGLPALRGAPAALRQWAAREKLPEVPDPARAAFLAGAPGKVFDASNVTGKFALVSSDDGICAVVTDQAGIWKQRKPGTGTSRAAVTLRLVSERNDKLNPKLHHREYLAARDGRTWRILIATVREDTTGPAQGSNQGGEVQGQAMLTAAPR